MTETRKWKRSRKTKSVTLSNRVITSLIVGLEVDRQQMASEDYEWNSVIHTFDVVGLDVDTQRERYGKLEMDYNVQLRGITEAVGGSQALLIPEQADRIWDAKDPLGEVDRYEAPIVDLVLSGITKREYDMTRYASTLPRVRPPIFWPDSLTDPSLQALDVLQKSILQRQGYHVHFNGLYRVVKQLGAGLFGRVYGLTMRTPEIDERVMDIIEATNIGSATNPFGLEELKRYLSTLPKWAAVKTSTDRKSAIREYVVGREVALALLPLGIRAVPAYFTLFSHQASETLPYTYDKRGMSEAERKLRQQEEADLYSVLGRAAGDPKEEILLYQEFVEGKTLFETQGEMDEGEMSVIYCYLHSVLSYLYKQLGFVHGDLHSNNVILKRRRGILPIIDEDGVVLAHLESRWEPVFIDLGMAKTNNVIISGGGTFYSTSQIYDITYMYRRIQFDNTLPISYQLVYDILNRGDIDIAEKRNGNYVNFFLPPGTQFKAEGDLTHARIVDAMLSSGELNRFMTIPEHTVLASTLSLYTDDSYVRGAPLIEQAERLLNRYTLAASGDQDVRRAVRSYLRETIDYYTSPEARMEKEMAAQLAMWGRK